MSFDTAGAVVDGSIYQMHGRGLTQELITTERMDIMAICTGFNNAFDSGSGRRWNVVSARSYEQIGAPSGVQQHRFELYWTFRDQTGRAVSLAAMDAGPGVKIIWWPSRQAIDAEMNQAFALTFLKLVVQLDEGAVPD